MKSGPLIQTLLISAAYYVFLKFVVIAYDWWAGDWLFALQMPSSCHGLIPESPFELRELCVWHVKRNNLILHLSQTLVLAGLFLSCFYPFRSKSFLMFSAITYESQR